MKKLLLNGFYLYKCVLKDMYDIRKKKEEKEKEKNNP